jgi:curved DNA-binding protein CbpA
MPEPADAYKVLQVDREAEDEVIQAAYRRLARKYHPDLAPDAEAARRMAAINAAWALIGTPAARAAYDGSLHGSAGPPTRETTPHRQAAPPARDAGTAARSTTDDRQTATPPPPERVSRDWTSGRSTVGGGFDRSMHTPDGPAAAGPPPGRPSGSVLNFGRYSGWSLGEIARHDLEYIEWLDRMPIGRTYRDEIDVMLRAAGRRRSTNADATERRGLFRRR